MKYFVTLTLLCISQLSFATGFHYCNGEITRLNTRATPEGTMIRIAGMNGWAKVGYGGTSYSDMHDRQVSMLLAADMGGKPVRLEFEDSSLICSDSHDGVLIRYVQLEN